MGPVSKAVQINTIKPGDVLARVDAYAERHGMTRSGVLAQAARREMEAA